MRDWLDYANFAVQCGLLGGLIWYALETYKLRVASQDQIEAQQKPALTIMSRPANGGDEVLDMNANGMAVVSGSGNVWLQNIGTGPAVNGSYHFNPINAPEDSFPTRIHGGLPSAQPGQKLMIPVATDRLRGFEYDFIASYESLSGRRYTSTIRINDSRITSFRLSEEGKK